MIKKFTPEETAAWFASLEKRMSSSTVAIHDEHDRVLVVKANYKHYWSFPGGIIDAGETPLEAGIREVSEEVGLMLEKDSLTFTFVVDRVSSVAQTYQFVFDAKVDATVFDSIVLEAEELDEFALVSRQQIIDGDRPYGESAKRWAEGYTGYAEQRFTSARPE
jgi:8-oxo-dGTP pyrophosphatase MutT (NUDIX family)